MTTEQMEQVKAILKKEFSCPSRYKHLNRGAYNAFVEGIAIKYGWRLNMGAYKYCFIIPDCDKVVKFPRHLNKPCDKEAVLCEVSLSRIMTLPKYNCAEVFAKVDMLCKVAGIPFVIQDKVDVLRKEHRPQLYISEGTFWEKRKPLLNNTRTDADYDFLEHIIRTYGKDFFRRFCMFVNRFHIWDLHNANVGYICNRPIILDFSYLLGR